MVVNSQSSVKSSINLIPHFWPVLMTIDLWSFFLLLVLYDDEFEQSERVAKHEKRHFVITKSVKHCLFIVQLW